jgi:hypothetical protein
MLHDIIEKLGDLSMLTGFSICDDIDKKGIWWNCKQCWSNIPAESTHHFVLQDDMMPCKNFIPALYEIIRTKTEQIIHIFASNQACIKALVEGKHWYTTPDGSWGGAIILPRKHFGWCAWADGYLQDFSPICDDTRLDHYAICNQEPIWCVTPSLIEHIGYDKSLIGNSPMKWRMSKRYIGEEDPMSIDWSKGANDPLVGKRTWGSSYDDLDVHLKHAYRLFFREKCGYTEKFIFRNRMTIY